MKSSYKNIIFTAASCIIICLTSCTSESCLEETDAKIKAPLYLYSTLVNTAPKALTVYGLNTESGYIYNNSKTTTQAELPLDPSSDTCAFVIMINSIKDTLTLIYDTYPHFISKECGYTYYYTIDTLSYSEHNIDSIIIRNRSVTTLDGENLRILY